MDWKVIEIPTWCKIQVPPESTYTWDDIGNRILIQLPTTPATQIVLACHTVRAEDVHKPVARCVEDILRDFCEHSIRSSLRITRAGYDVEVALVDELGAYVGQAVAKSDLDQWWLVRVYRRSDSEDYFILIWTGPAESMRKTVLLVYESLELL